MEGGVSLWASVAFLSVCSGSPEFTSWGQWSSCSKTCDNGDRTRVRSCISYCNDVESSDLSSTEICQDGDCNSVSSISSPTTMTPKTTTMTLMRSEGKIFTVKEETWVTLSHLLQALGKEAETYFLFIIALKIGYFCLTSHSQLQRLSHFIETLIFKYFLVRSLWSWIKEYPYIVHFGNIQAFHL